MKFALVLYFGFVGFLSPSKAGEPEDQTAVNPKLNLKAEALIKSAMKVIKEDEGEVHSTSPGHSFAAKTQILFFRRRGTRIEMIATGVFNREKVDAKTGNKTLITNLDRDNITKYPQQGDYAVPMNDPNLNALNAKDGNDFPAPDEPEPNPYNPLPGYIEFGMGIMNGTLSTTSSQETNISKITSGYRFALTHLAYYSDFVPLGFEMDSYKGNFPTKTYLSTVVTSSESISCLSFSYRFKPLLKDHLALTARVGTISESFTTNNIDASLLTSKASGLGFGLRAQFQIVPPNWKKEPKEFFIQAQSFFGELLYYPTISVIDQDVSRGTSSAGSTLMQYRLGATALAWISFIPIFKRWVIQGSYGSKAYHLKFSGPTVSEAGNPVPVSANGSGTETESDYRVFIGIRFDDPVKFLFGNEEKK